MLFQWITKGRYDLITDDHFQKIGTRIVGLRKKGERPYEVVLNMEELLYLRRNPSYMDTLITSLSNKKQGDNATS